MDFNDPISYSLEIKNLGANGYEVIVSIVNEGEAFLLVKRSHVEIIKDSQSCGRHKLSFVEANKLGEVRLGQFEIANGHFHLDQDFDHRLFHFKLDIDYRYDDHDNTRKISRRIDTHKITKAK